MAAVLAGCGSSDDGPSKAEFTKKADAICKSGDRKIEAAARKTFISKKTPSQAELRTFIKAEAIPTVRKQVEGIKKLDPPKDDEDEVRAITDGADAALAKVEANPQLAAAQGAKSPFAKANNLARDYGLESCGSGSG